MILTLISDKCKHLKSLEIVFLRFNRQEHNEKYGDEIKTFLQAIGDNPNIKDTMETLIFDSHCNEVMIGLTSSFHMLKTLKIIDCNYLEGEYFPLIKSNCLQELDLSGSHQIEYEHILNLVRNNATTLNTLKVDGENIDGTEFNELVESIDCLVNFSVYFAQKADKSLLLALCKHRESLENLVIRKNEEFEEEDFETLFSAQ